MIFSTEELELIVSDEEVDLRLDQLLAKRFYPNFSRTYFEKLIEEGFVTSDGKILKKREKLLPGREVEIFFRPIEGYSLEAEPIPLDIIYEDADILVINKPVGMVVHPAPGHPKGTFVNALIHHCQEVAKIKSTRPGIVHRLDKDTSGLLVGAKHEEAQRRMIKRFSDRSVEKEYVALADGSIESCRVETYICRDLRDRKKMANSTTQGKKAISHVERIASNNNLTWVRVRIETGRTHQIRLHLLHLKAPVLGDLIYNNSKRSREASRLFLHAHRLKFLHPMNEKPLDLEAPIPKLFTEDPPFQWPCTNSAG